MSGPQHPLYVNMSVVSARDIEVRMWLQRQMVNLAGVRRLRLSHQRSVATTAGVRVAGQTGDHPESSLAGLYGVP